MGNAHKTPDPERAFRYWISEHALERFRERVEEDHKSLSDRALGLLLDDRIHAALVAGKSQAVIDADNPSEETRIVEVEDRRGVKSIVVMRKHGPSNYPRTRCVDGPGTPAPLAITILTSEMASSNLVTGRWRMPNRPFAAKLANVKIEPVHAKPAPTPAPVPAVPPKPAEPTLSRGGSTLERIEFVKSVLRDRPSIKHGGPDGLSEIVKAKFGVGMSLPMFNEIRETMERESMPPIHGRVEIPVITAPPPAPSRPREPSVAERLPAAIAAEVAAKESLAAFDKHAAEQRAKLAQDLRDASEEVERLMAALAEMRK